MQLFFFSRRRDKAQSWLSEWRRLLLLLADWRGGGAVTRFCLSTPNSFRAPRPTGDSIPSNMPQRHTDVLTSPVRLVWRPTITTTRPPLVTVSLDFFFFLLCPRTCLAYFHKSKKKKTPPSVKTRYGERRLFLHSRRNIEGSLFFSPPRRERMSWRRVQPVWLLKTWSMPIMWPNLHPSQL